MLSVETGFFAELDCALVIVAVCGSQERYQFRSVKLDVELYEQIMVRFGQLLLAFKDRMKEQVQ